MGIVFVVVFIICCFFRIFFSEFFFVFKRINRLCGRCNRIQVTEKGLGYLLFVYILHVKKKPCDSVNIVMLHVLICCTWAGLAQLDQSFLKRKRTKFHQFLIASLLLHPSGVRQKKMAFLGSAGLSWGGWNSLIS